MIIWSYSGEGRVGILFERLTVFEKNKFARIFFVFFFCFFTSSISRSIRKSFKRLIWIRFFFIQYFRKLSCRLSHREIRFSVTLVQPNGPVWTHYRAQFCWRAKKKTKKKKCIFFQLLMTTARYTVVRVKGRYKFRNSLDYFYDFFFFFLFANRTEHFVCCGCPRVVLQDIIRQRKKDVHFKPICPQRFWMLRNEKNELAGSVTQNKINEIVYTTKTLNARSKVLLVIFLKRFYFGNFKHFRRNSEPSWRSKKSFFGVMTARHFRTQILLEIRFTDKTLAPRRRARFKNFFCCIFFRCNIYIGV